MRQAYGGFANDDSGIYIALSSHVAEEGAFETIHVRDHRFEVRLAEPDGSGQRTVLEREGRSLSSVLLEASAGYLLVTSSEGGTSLGWRTEVVRLEGGVELLEAGNDARPRYLPDPTGTILARVRSVCDPELCVGWVSRHVQYVSFYDAETLEPVGALHAVEWPQRDEINPAVTWSPDGRLVVSDGVEAFALALDGTREAVVVPSCRGFVTAGGQAADGRWPDVSWDGAEVDVRIVDGDGPGWPDRCFEEGL